MATRRSPKGETRLTDEDVENFTDFFAGAAGISDNIGRAVVREQLHRKVKKAGVRVVRPTPNKKARRMP